MSRLSAARRSLNSPALRRKLRYVSVTAVFVPLGQILLQVIVYVGFRNSDRGRSDVLANLIVATILTPPYYLAMRRFVWQRDSTEQLGRDATVFWVLAVAGLIASSATLWIAAQLFPTDDATWRGLRVFVASLTGTGIFWVGRYLIADRWLFADDGDDGEDGDPGS